MSELLWPGEQRAGALFDDASLITAMTAVERAWLEGLRTSGLAPDGPDLPEIVRLDGVEEGGNPVIPLVAALRAAAEEPTRTWVHRGLTSQDVLDTALVLCLREAVVQVGGDVRRQVAALRRLADEHRADVRAGRTLTQHAVPTTFGLTAAGWLDGVLDAANDLQALVLPVQVGGAGGTMAAVVALGGDTSALTAHVASSLGLVTARPWHTNRRPITRAGDALTACVDAWGRIANDVLVAVRPEIGELSESTVVGRGGSSTMPHKQNPTLSVLIKRAALVAPSLGAVLHTACAGAVDDRPDGAWQAEWMPLALLARLTAVAASQTAELLEGLEVRSDRMRSTAEAASADLLSEQQSMTGSATALEGYLGATEQIIDAALVRADDFLAETS